MTKITRKMRTAIRAIIADSGEYDPATISIARDGSVSARKDPDKTFAGADPVRYLVGHVDDMVSADGQRLAGW